MAPKVCILERPSTTRITAKVTTVYAASITATVTKNDQVRDCQGYGKRPPVPTQPDSRGFQWGHVLPHPR